MIDRLYIYNFRRIRYGMIEFRDGLTVLCGKNGTGKSTAIEALDFNLYGKPGRRTTLSAVAARQTTSLR